MSIPGIRSPHAAPPPEPRGGDDYSPGFAALALLLTVGLLTALVVVLWALEVM